MDMGKETKEMGEKRRRNEEKEENETERVFKRRCAGSFFCGGH